MKEEAKPVPRVLAVRSWLGKFSAYVRLLEAMVHDQAEYISILQDRHERVLSGYGLREEIPNAVDLVKAQQEAMSTPRTIEDLRIHKEAESRRRREQVETAATKVDFRQELNAVKSNGQGEVRNADK